MHIQAALTKSNSKVFDIEEIEIDEPRANEILVKIHGVGLCHTDLVVRDFGELLFPSPSVLGHEGSGVVAAIGSDVTKVAVGDRVAMTFHSCGTCDRCEQGPASYCRDFQQLNMAGKRKDGSTSLSNDDGPISSNFFGQSAFASHALAYERNVVKIADGIPTELAGPLGCGIQTGAGAIINSLAVPEGASLLITGGGPVGLSAVMAAKIQGAGTVILVEPQESRRDFAMEVGATHTINPDDTKDLAKAVRAILPQGVDFALDTTGLDPVMQKVTQCLGSRAVFGIVGLSALGTPMPGDVNVMVNLGVTIRGIIEGDSDPDIFLPQLMQHHLAGQLPFDRMITTYPLSEINRAIQEQHDGKCIKAVLIPGG